MLLSLVFTSLLTLWQLLTVCSELTSRVANLRALNKKNELLDASILDRKLQTNSVTFKLFNAVQVPDMLITDLDQNEFVNLGSIPPGNLNIQVVSSGWKPASVRISLTGAVTRTVVEGGTFTLCGNSGSNFAPCNNNLILGRYNIQAELFSGALATGQLLTTSSIDFVLANATVAPAPAPITAPIPVPVFVPVISTAPVPVPVPVSLPQPVIAPLPIPVSFPITVPVPQPVNSTPPSCPVPKLVGNWENWEKYPIPVAESMGALIGDDFLVVSGFSRNFNTVTRKVYAFNVRTPNSKWHEMDEVPVPGFTHAGYAVDGSIMYVCGSYVGGVNVIRDGPICLKYNHTAPRGQQWSFLPSLPDGRGGGGFFHIKETNSLLYATGATRRGTTIDQTTTWELLLDNISAGWITRAPTLYKANHIAHVTAFYQGKYRYYIAGGQLQQKESSSNQPDLLEWDQASKTWIRRANMILPRGHASASTIPYGCGFIMIGGAINTGTTTSDISYYGINTNTWIKIGDLPRSINTPVCDIVRNLNGSDWVYCNTGPVSTTNFHTRRRISL